MVDPDFSEIAAAFRHARLQLGWSQELFAEKALVSVGTIRAAEAGVRISARSHKALINAINKAREGCRPPVGALTIEFPVIQTLGKKNIPEHVAETPSTVSPPTTIADPVEYPDRVTTEPVVNDDSTAWNSSVQIIPLPLKKGDPPRIFWADEQSLFGGANDGWRIKDICEGVVIFGATGSGKTSGSGQLLAREYLRAGFGGLVLCAKPDEPDLWKRYAALMDREADIVLFGTDPRWSFNFLEHESRRQGAGASLTENLVNLFTEIASIGAGSSGGSTSDPFWERAMKSLVRNCVDLLAAAGVPVTLHKMFEVVRSAPTCVEIIRSEEWRRGSPCWQYVQTANKYVTKRLFTSPVCHPRCR